MQEQGQEACLSFPDEPEGRPSWSRRKLGFGGTVPSDLERDLGESLTSPAHNCVIHAARNRAATSCLKLREETFIVFFWVLITLYNTIVGQRKK